MLLLYIPCSSVLVGVHCGVTNVKLTEYVELLFFDDDDDDGVNPHTCMEWNYYNVYLQNTN